MDIELKRKPPERLPFEVCLRLSENEFFKLLDILTIASRINLQNAARQVNVFSSETFDKMHDLTVDLCVEMSKKSRVIQEDQCQFSSKT